jgi:hypothetical protein
MQTLSITQDTDRWLDYIEGLPRHEYMDTLVDELVALWDALEDKGLTPPYTEHTLNGCYCRACPADDGGFLVRGYYGPPTNLRVAFNVHLTEVMLDDSPF